MIYLGSPFSHDNETVRDARHKAAVCATAMLGAKGEYVFSPILHSVPQLDFGLPNTWEFWKDIDFAHLQRCDELWVLTLPGWQQSVGVKQEIEWAKELGKPVRYLDPVTLECA